MLKIKDNVELKELEKFGFEENELIRSNGEKYFVLKKMTDACSYYVDIYFVVNLVNNHLRFDTSAYAIQDIDAEDFAEVLFDLIQAGLVEKVVEDE